MDEGGEKITKITPIATSFYFAWFFKTNLIPFNLKNAVHNQGDHLGAIIIRELSARHVHLEECPKYKNIPS